MERGEIEEVAARNFAIYQDVRAVFEAREEIMKKVVERRSASINLEREKRELIRTVLVLEGKYNAFAYLIRQAEGMLNINVAAAEQILLLCESCERLMEFLVDFYDRAPESFRKKVSRDELLAAAASLEVEKSEADRDFVEKNIHPMALENLVAIHNSIYWTTEVLLGEENYCFVMAEFNDAMEALSFCPGIKEFFRKT